MMKRLSLMLFAFLLTLCVTAASWAQESALSAEELLEFVEGLRTRALESQPLNNPADPDSVSEDGTLFAYDFASLYAASAEMTEDAVLTACVISDPEEVQFRGRTADLLAGELLSLFRNDNPTLAGTRGGALLYLDGTAADGYVYGQVTRDGQRIQFIEYGILEQTEAGPRLLSALFGLTEGYVVSLRVDGMAEATTAEAAQALYDSLAELGAESDYTQAPTSLNGLELTALAEEDLTINGTPFLRLQPESFGGLPEDVLMENDEGTWMRVIEGDGFTAVFACDAEGGNARISSFSILSDDYEGPRGVRLGDQFHEDFTRFRNGEQETDGTTEVLYGLEGTAPYGMAYYADGDGMTLRYVTATAQGQDVELYLHYTQNTLSEIILHTIEP